MYSPLIQKLIDLFSEFPGVGPRSASRFVFYLINEKKERVEELIELLTKLSREVKLCSFCFRAFEGEGELCEICSDKKRNKGVICLVEKEADVEAIERTGKFQGLYFILGGLLSGFEKEEKKERIKKRILELVKRIKEAEGKIQEVIVALSPTTEGRYTFFFFEKALKENKVLKTPKITFLAQGIPSGGEIEYADPETLISAFEGRQPLKRKKEREN